MVYTKGITLSTTTKNKHTSFCIHVIGDSVDNFQREIFTTTKHSKRFWNVNITRNIWDNYIFRKRCKITVDNKCLHQVKSFKYLICDISFENETEIEKEWKEEPADTKLRR